MTLSFMGARYVAGLGLSLAGHVAFGYLSATGSPLAKEFFPAEVINYFAAPVGLFFNGLCNVSIMDEFGLGPVDYANLHRRNGMTVSKDKDGQIHYHTISGKPRRKVGRLEVGLVQGVVAQGVNTAALAVGVGAGLLAKKFS
jgi:hypothetical protein